MQFVYKIRNNTQVIKKQTQLGPIVNNGVLLINKKGMC